MADQPATKQRPYLLRAMHEWMIDNGFTPHIVASAASEGLRIPEEHVRDGKIVFNVSYTATRALVLGNDEIRFEARFNGIPREINIPIDAVLGIYARETGQGMIFSDEDQASVPAAPDDGDKKTSRPTLKIVK